MGLVSCESSGNWDAEVEGEGWYVIKHRGEEGGRGLPLSVCLSLQILMTGTVY